MESDEVSVTDDAFRALACELPQDQVRSWTRVHTRSSPPLSVDGWCLMTTNAAVRRKPASRNPGAYKDAIGDVCALITWMAAGV